MIRKAIGLLLCATVSAMVAASAASAAEKVKLKMAEVVRSQFYVPMYVALAKGFVADEGLEVELVTANGGDRAGAMLLSGQTEFALAGPEVPIYIYNGESPDKPVIFCALTATDGLFLASRQKIDKFDWSMLNGKKILGWRPGSTPELYLEYVLKQSGVDADTVKTSSPISACHARDGACMSGIGDFAIFNEPNMTKMEKAGAGQYRGLHRQGGRARRLHRVLRQEELAREEQELAQKWTNAIARAQAWIKTASEKEIAEAIAPFFPGLTIEDNIAVVNRYRTVGVPIWATSTWSIQRRSRQGAGDHGGRWRAAGRTRRSATTRSSTNLLRRQGATKKFASK